ncbi:MAG: NAD(P)-dependent oxidoreductase, partial [Enterocloster sp.]
NAISEHVCMTALMMIRNMKRQLRMISDGDYSLKGIKGRELRKMTVGIVGAGRIGFETIKIFRSFTPDLLVYDMIERNDVKEYASYVSLEELYERSDMIIYHCPLTEENYHMVNEKTIAGMKEGVILINPARGGLWDYKAVYENLKTGRIGSVAFDVYETEKNYLRRQVPPEELKDEVLTGLIRHERAIYTAHSAFFTDAAIENMFEVTAKNLLEYRKKGSCGNELTDR